MALEQFRLGMKRRCFAFAISREATGKTMSHEHIAQIIAAPIIILIILWTPLFDLIGPSCVRFFNADVRKKPPSPELSAERRRHRQPEGQGAPKAAITALEGLTVEQHVSWKKAADRIKKMLEE